MRRSHPPKTNTLSRDSYSWDLDQFIWLIQPRMTLVFATIIIPKVWILRIREPVVSIVTLEAGSVQELVFIGFPETPEWGYRGYL